MKAAGILPLPSWERAGERGRERKRASRTSKSRAGALSPDARTPLPTLSHKGRGLFFLLLAVLFAVLPAMAAQAAPNFPQFTGLVTDAANVIPADQKAALEARLQALKQQTGRQLVVATIPDLQGYDIADYGYQLGRSWGVGLKGLDNGAILIVAPKEHKVRVEVGYGLEPVLTDAFSSVVIQQAIVPRFKAGDMAGGISAGVDALAQQLSLPDDQAKTKMDAAVAAYDKQHAHRSNGHIPLGAIIWIVIVAVVIISHIGRRASRGRYYGGGGGSNWPIWLWAASEMMDNNRHGGSWGGGGSSGGGDSGGGWMGGGFSGGGGGSFGGGGASGSW